MVPRVLLCCQALWGSIRLVVELVCVRLRLVDFYLKILFNIFFSLSDVAYLYESLNTKHDATQEPVGKEVIEDSRRVAKLQ